MNDTFDMNSKNWVLGHRLVAAFAFLLSLVVYTMTLNSSVPFWDAGEFVATAYVLGIPHPPGTPLYVLIGRIFSMVPGVPVVVAMNWLSAVASSLAILWTYLLTVRFIRRTQGPTRTNADEIIAWTGGLAASFFAAFCRTFWDSAVEAEVYALSSWMQVFILWLGLKWWEGLEKGEGDNRLIVAVYLCFLSIGIHLGSFLVMPGLLLLVLMVNWKSLLSPRNLLWAAGLAVVGVSVHLYLYIRANANPPINEGDPETWDALWALLNREQYGSRPMFPRSAPLLFQFNMYWQYFIEQYVLSSRLGALAWVLPLAVGLFGAIGHGFRDKKSFVVQFVTWFLTSIGLIFYLNFTDHEVRKRDYFFTSSFHFFAIWIGMGMAFLLEWAREVSKASMQRAVLVAGSVLVVLISLLPMVDGWVVHNRHGFYVARDYAFNMLDPLLPDSFVFTNGDNDTFPLWYIQEVEAVRKDVRVINLSLLNTDWYIRQLRDNEPRVPMTVTDADIERVRQYGYMVDAQGNPMMVNAWMVQNILAANQGRRPAYLAVTVPDRQGLDNRLLLEALVYKILEEPPTPTSSIVRTTSAWMDEPLVRKRLYEDFIYRNLFDEDGNFITKPYKDENARRLSQNYAAAHIQLAYHYRRLGDYSKAESELERVLRMFPDFASVRAQLGAFKLESGDTAGAFVFFEKAVQTDPSPDLFYYFGLGLGMNGQTDRAVQMLMTAADMDPTDTQPYLAAFSLLSDRGRIGEAKQVLEKLLVHHPGNQQARAYLNSLDTLRRESWTGTSGGPNPGSGPGRP